MERKKGLLCALIVAVYALEAGKCLQIAAFNVQVFGQTKFAKDEVVGVLKQIVRRYDIILIQEIRDSSETIIFDFTNIVNNGSSDVYDLVVSERLGRSRSKEQYAFLYRRAVVKVVETYQHNDTEDEFEREPFSALFRAIATGEEFFLVAIHVKPADVRQELESLGPAFELASDFFNSSRGVVMGDLNAGCRYLSRSRYQELSLVTDPSFIWLLGYDVDTTVASSSCPYDRFIVHESLNCSVVEGSATIFNYTEAYSLSSSQAEDVSDHYPIEFQLQLCSRKCAVVTNSSPSPSPSSHGLDSGTVSGHASLTLGLVAMAFVINCL